MYIIIINEETCEGCGDCTEACPVELLILQKGSDRKVATVGGSLGDCLGCEACAVICPTESITVMEA